MQQKPELWHFDKGIPLSVIALVLLQALGVVWWFGDLSKQTQQNTQRIEQIEAQRVGERLTALESQRVDDRALLIRIDNKLDRIIEKDKQ